MSRCIAKRRAADDSRRKYTMLMQTVVYEVEEERHTTNRETRIHDTSLDFA